jgi:hypothetical protein
MFLEYLKHHPIIAERISWDPMKSANSSHLSDSVFLVSSTLRDCLTFLLSLPVVTGRSPVQAHLHALYMKILDSFNKNRYSHNLSGDLTVLFTDTSQACIKLRQTRLQLSRSLKHTMHYESTAFIDNQNFRRNQITTPMLIDKLHRLHRRYPFGIGGPQLNPFNLPAWALYLDKLNNDVGIHWLKGASLQEGRRWIQRGLEGVKDRKQVELMETFWTTALEQVRQIPSRDGHPNSRQFELMLRSRMSQGEGRVVTVAVLGLINSGFVTE